MKLFHIAISVNNLGESRSFYESVFYLKFRSEGERTDLKIKFVNLEDENYNVIELFEHEAPLPSEENSMDFQKIGIKHIAFVVDDIDLAIGNSLTHGGRIIWPAQKGVTVKRTAFIADPNGIPVELVELI